MTDDLTRRTAWVCAQREEHDPQRLWVSVLDGLRGTAAASALVRPLTASPDLDGWAIAERLLEDLVPLREPICLVIDDLIAEILRLLAALAEPAVQQQHAPLLLDPLTDSETRVLHYLPTHLTAAEIAQQLHLSVHTITTHMRHLYVKLGAHRRHEAVRQARALGLLVPSPPGP